VPGIVEYSQQFYVSVIAQPSGGGSVTQGQWVNASKTLSFTATSSPGWSFQGWKGQGGTDAYSGVNQSYTIKIDGPTMETASFYPSLGLSASTGGHISYAYPPAPGVVKSNTNGTVFLPAATTVTLTAAPDSIFYIFKGWTGGINSTSRSISITTSSPVAERATFGYNLFLFGIFGASGLTAPPLAASLLGGRRQRYRVGQVVWYNNGPWIVTSFSKGKRGKFYNLRTTRSQSGSQGQ
jgi:hypothetical protein